MKRLLIILAAAATLAACGGSGHKQVNANAIDRAFMALPNATRNVLGNPKYGDCSISVVLTSAKAIALYGDAGDAIATNPTGTAGVKISTSVAAEPNCLRTATNVLRHIR